MEHVIIIMVQIIIKTFQRNLRAAEQLEAILGQPCTVTQLRSTQSLLPVVDNNPSPPRFRCCSENANVESRGHPGSRHKSIHNSKSTTKDYVDNHSNPYHGVRHGDNHKEGRGRHNSRAARNSVVDDNHNNKIHSTIRQASAGLRPKSTDRLPNLEEESRQVYQTSHQCSNLEDSRSAGDYGEKMWMQQSRWVLSASTC